MSKEQNDSDLYYVCNMNQKRTFYISFKNVLNTHDISY
ncbi:hypothetical protein BC059799_0501 [Bacillus cereus NVH0597-99]|nr:hypothetical protein BC059799_0501 [Bacillus cereus NVH0597-99]